MKGSHSVVLCIDLSTVAQTKQYTYIIQTFVMSTLTTLLQVWGEKLYLAMWHQNMVGKIGPKFRLGEGGGTPGRTILIQKEVIADYNTNMEKGV